jgi:hypothetical protein
MPRPLNISPGDRFGMLTIIEETPRQRRADGTALRAFTVRCECGVVKDVRLHCMTEGATLSCGCFHRLEAAKVGRETRTHGMGKTSLYRTWSAMKTRCHNPNDGSYWRYGARGIQVCQEWRDSFEAFAAHVGERPEGLTLDRINAAGNYEPGNVRWATYTEQARNTRRNIWVAVNDKRVTLAEACETLDWVYDNARYHINKFGKYEGVSRVQ